MITYNYTAAYNFAYASHGNACAAHYYAAACVADGAAKRKNGRKRPVRRAALAWERASAAYSPRA